MTEKIPIPPMLQTGWKETDPPDRYPFLRNKTHSFALFVNHWERAANDPNRQSVESLFSDLRKNLLFSYRSFAEGMSLWDRIKLLACYPIHRWRRRSLWR